MVYSEAELVVPALEVIRDNAEISTSKLIKELTARMQPTGKDAEIISGRKDTYFSQKVRNLKSHDTLQKKDVATYIDGKWYITPKGRTYLEENSSIAESMREQGFNPKTIEKEAEDDFKGVIIEEGALEKVNVSQRARSSKLKKIAIQNHKDKHDGKLPCSACSFDFEETYGEQGKEFIEIHHIEPVHEMDIAGSKTKIEEALNKVIPLCSNCHRMVHRKKNKMLSIEELKAIIK